MTFGAVAHINLDNLQHNFAVARSHAPNSKILAMVKGDGYGHGLVHVANALDKADGFGVANLDEALILKNAGINIPIVIMRGFVNLPELEISAKNDFHVVIHDQHQLDILAQANLINPINVWLKIDTGMHRLGFDLSRVTDIYSFLNNNRNIKHPINLMSHFSDADNVNKDKTDEQLRLFKTIKLSQPKSLANSAAIFSCPDSYISNKSILGFMRIILHSFLNVLQSEKLKIEQLFLYFSLIRTSKYKRNLIHLKPRAHPLEVYVDWVRPGIMLYGVSPVADCVGSDYGLKPVMTFQTKLIAVKQIAAGSSVGYGETWQCQRDTRLGAVAIGYGDGYPWHAINGTPVLINGILSPLVGRVSMDVVTVDLTDNPSAKVEDKVILWGEGLPIEHVAKYANTISYELLCRLTKRVDVVYF